MYIVAIGWIYVVVLMALTEESVAAGLATFLFYGIAPLAVLLYLMGTPQRRRNRRRRESMSEAGGDESVLQPDESRHAAADAVAPVAPEAVAVGDRAGAERGNR